MTSELALAILLATSSLAPDVLDSLGHAPPAMVARLSQACVGTGDIRITAGEIVYQVRIGRLNAAGMGGFKTRGSAPRPPDPLAWPLVTRMDAVHSSRGLGMMLGAVAGAAIGWPAEAVVLGATAGMWIGGRVGSMRVREVPLYIAQPGAAQRLALDPAAAAAAAAVAVPSLVAAGAVDAASGTVGEPSAERIREACTEIRSGSMLRVTFTSMTLTEGQVSRADDAGLHALRPELTKGSNPPLPEVIPWARILQVEKRVGSSGAGALRGGVPLGILGAAIGAAFAAGGGTGGSGGGGGAEVAGGAAAGALICGAIGAGFGAMIGAAVPRWRVVY